MNAMIGMQDVSRISILSRRPVKMAEDANDPRIHVVLHNDFAEYSADVLAQLSGASGCVWALGTGQNTVTEEWVVRADFLVKNRVPD